MIRKLSGLFAGILIASGSAVIAAEEPEAVYGKFHRAIVLGNLDEVMKHAPAARRAEMAGMSPAQKDAQIKMLSLMLPRAFTLMGKRISPNGKIAHLAVTGPGQPIIAGAAPEKLYGQVKLISEDGEWKVEELAWSNEKPAMATQSQASPASAKSTGPKPAMAARPAAAAPQPPAPKLGEAKAPCVYKPVMTNEDLERCR